MTPTAHQDDEHVVIRFEGAEARLTVKEAAALRARIDDAARLARRHRDDRAKAEREAAQHAAWRRAEGAE
jgi:hypothetical protein